MEIAGKGIKLGVFIDIKRYEVYNMKLKIIFIFEVEQMIAAKGYKTKQRETILNFLMENKERHITVDEIVFNLKNRGVSVGKTTVYRYIDKLVEEGRARRFITDEKSGACFQYVDGNKCDEHFHLKCVECGKLIHLECGHLSEIAEHVYESHKFTIDNSKTVLYGICDSCEASRERKSDEK